MLRTFILLLSLTAAVAAKEIRLTAPAAGSYALAHNPSLAAARLRIEEARGRLQQSGRLTNPELEVELTKNTMGREGSFAIGLMQRFPVTARLRHQKAVSRAELAAAEAEVRDAERKVVAEVGTAVVKLLALNGQRDLRVRQLANTRELSSFLFKRVQTGEAASVDASQVDLEARQIEIESLQLAADETVLIGELRPLLGIPSADRIIVAGDLAAPRSIPAATTVTERADIRAAESRADAARWVVLEQRSRRWEDLGIGASYLRDRTVDEPEGLETDQIFGLRFSLPLPIWNTNAGRIREAEAASARARQEVDATKLAANAEVAAARAAAMSAYATLIGELDDKVLPAATRIEDQLRNSYSTGLTPMTEVLRARTKRLELERHRLDALREYQLARIRHAAATATAPAFITTSEK